jgi:microcompartment protein CcmK/EutM
MANVDSAFGFRPINRDGSPYNGATLRCVFAAADTTAAFIGDPVVLDGSSSEGYPGVTQAASDAAVFGVVTGFEANPDSLSDQYRKASTKRFCQVASASGNYFEVQSDDDTTALAEASVGLNTDFIVAAGSTAYGVSGCELDSSEVAVTSTLDLQIVGLVDRADNLLAGTGSTNKNVIVKFNDAQDKNERTGIS